MTNKFILAILSIERDVAEAISLIGISVINDFAAKRQAK